MNTHGLTHKLTDNSATPPVLDFEPVEGALDMADGARDTAWMDKFTEVVRLNEVNEASVCEIPDLKEDKVLLEFVRVVVVGTVSVLRDDTDVPFRGNLMGLLLGVGTFSSSSLSLLISITSSAGLDLFTPRFELIARTLSSPAGVRKVKSASSTSSPLSSRPPASGEASLSSRRLPPPLLSSSLETLRETESSLTRLPEGHDKNPARVKGRFGHNYHFEDEKFARVGERAGGEWKDQVCLHDFSSAGML